MTWPLIERELRVALHKRQLHRTLWWGTLASVGLTLLFLLFGGVSNANWGIGLNKLLFLGGLIIIAQVPNYTVGIFAEERRNQTLGLLFLCGINSTELFLSKTLGSALVSFNRLVLLYPFLAISFLGGGLSIDQFLATAVSLPVLLMYVISVCVLASVLCQQESTAMFVAVIIAVMPGIITSILHLVAAPQLNLNAFTDRLLVLGPPWPAYLAFRQLSIGTIGEFWKASAISILWSLLIFGGAGSLLGRVWQDKPEVVRRGTLAERLRDLLHGDAAWRGKLFHRWQSLNPFVWLAMRDRWLVTLAWGVVGAVALGWLLACLFWPEHWTLPLPMFLTAIFLNYSLNWLSIFAAAKTVGDNRRSGGLELLLTTPLNHLDIIRGQRTALREQFRPVASAVIAIEIIMLAVGIAARPWTGASLAVYLIIWMALIWGTSHFTRSFRNTLPVFWDSLVCGRPAYVALQTSGLARSPVWIAYLVFMGGNVLRSLSGIGMKSFPAGTPVEYLFCGVGLIVLIWTQAIRRGSVKEVEGRLASDLRAIATKPMPEPSDPGYKSWKSGEHFPGMFADAPHHPMVPHVRKETTQSGNSH